MADNSKTNKQEVKVSAVKVPAMHLRKVIQYLVMQCAPDGQRCGSVALLEQLQTLDSRQRNYYDVPAR